MHKLLEYKKKNFPLIGIGTVSTNTVNAVIEYANDFNFPLMLIASRNQIDNAGGYVNSWNSGSFADYVRSKDLKSNVLICRDHGGPWQNTVLEKDLPYDQALSAAKESFEVDISVGFDIIHIDTSIKPPKGVMVNTLESFFDNYLFCMDKIKEYGKNVIFEVSLESESPEIGNPSQVEYQVCKILEFCSRKEIVCPKLFTVHTGTYVREDRNMGKFDANSEICRKQIREIVDIFEKRDLLLKAHNSDYLPDNNIRGLSELGVHSFNIAPEFGVCETKTFFSLCRENGMNKLSDKFLELAYQSEAWKKWLIAGKECSDYKKAIISGHYVFSTTEFLEIREEVILELNKKGVDLDLVIKNELKSLISRLIKAIGCFDNANYR